MGLKLSANDKRHMQYIRDMNFVHCSIYDDWCKKHYHNFESKNRYSSGPTHYLTTIRHSLFLLARIILSRSHHGG